MDDCDDDDEGESYFVDRPIHHRSTGAQFLGYGKGKRTPGKFSGRRRFVPPDVIIICDKKGCHSSKHRNQSRALLLRAAKAFVGTTDVISGDETDSKDDERIEIDGDDSEDGAALEYHVNSLRAMSYMGVPGTNTNVIVDGAVLDTG